MTAALETGMEALRGRFLRRAQEDLARLAAALEALETGARASTEVHEEMRGILHRLAGSAGSFGQTALGVEAAHLERQLEAAPSDHSAIARWRANIAALARTLPTAPG